MFNLPLDSNYGGNLQRFALIKTLQDLGHEPEHIQIRFVQYKLPIKRKIIEYPIRLIKKLFNNRQHVFKEKYAYKKYLKNLSKTQLFYDTYVPHTNPCYCKEDIQKVLNYDFYIIGSDQVWRKRIAGRYLDVFMGSLLPDNVKRVAFAVSFGTDVNELSIKETTDYSKLYKKFSAVSVREDSGLDLLDDYGWIEPKAVHLLDPTFLLKKEDYIKITERGEITEDKPYIFCYILDISDDKNNIINEISNKAGLKKKVVSLNDDMNIENWLKYINEAELVITDSFHGLVFSIIFNKQYILVRNEFRGNARFDSLLRTFGLKDDGRIVDWNRVNNIIEENKLKAMNFLTMSIQSSK